MVLPVPGVSASRALEQLGSRHFDVLVVGGGVVGASTAAHAARHGLQVALVEAGDFGGATSSASSKLIHGGLRYLRLGDVGLVREAHSERLLLTDLVAPHLVHRLPFVFPFFEGGPYSPLTVEAGIVVYSALARARPRRPLRAGAARRATPGLRSDGLRGAAVYGDAWTNDARLSLASVRAAAVAGTVVLNGAEVVSFHRSGGRVVAADVTAGGTRVTVRSRAVVNAAGPWTDVVRRLEDPGARPSVRLSKGAHVIVPGGAQWGAALIVPQDAERVTFAIPWYGMLLLGTTDTLHEGDPGSVSVEPRDVEQVLREAGAALEPELVRPERVRGTFAGLRVLPAGEGESVSARRETVYSTGTGGVLSVAGGKLTTHRRIALGVLERLRADLHLRRVDHAPWPLPGAAGLDRVELPVEVEPDVRANLLHLYGSLAPEVLAPAVEDPSLLERLHPDGPDVAAQALYAGTHEWARTPDDVVRRRTTLWHRGLADEQALDRVAALLRRSA